MVKIHRRFRKIERRFYLTFKQQLVWMISTAFAIAAALMWKDTITLALNKYITFGSDLAYSFYAAIIVTVIGVVVIWLSHEIFKNK